MYQKKISELKIGEKVELKVIESNDLDIIVSYKGQLLRVSNKTGNNFEVGSKIFLLVKKIKPLEFSLPSRKGFNVWV